MLVEATSIPFHSILTAAVDVWSTTAAAACAIALGAGIVFVAFVVAWLSCGPRIAFLRWTAMAAAAAFLLTAVFHVLAALQLFARGPALGVITLLATVAFLATRRHVRDWWRQEQQTLRRFGRRLWKSPYRLAVLVWVMGVAPPILRALILPPLGWDALTLHATKAAMWVQHGSVAGMEGPGPWAYYRLQLAGAEVFLAWAMLPLRSDVLVPLVDVLEWFGLGLGLIVLGRTLRIREPFTSTAVGFVLALPTIRLMIGSGYVELLSIAALAGGIALGAATSRTRRKPFLLAGALLGIAAATKVNMIPIAGVALLMLTIRELYSERRKSLWYVSGAALLFAVAVGPWLLRSLHETGTLLAPYPIRVGAWAIGQAPEEVAGLLRRPAQELASRGSEIAVLKRVFARGSTLTPALGVMAALPIALSLIGVPSLMRRSPGPAVAMLVAAGTCVIMYFSESFQLLRHHWTLSSSRFLVPLVAFAALASVAWCRRASWSSTAYAAVLWLAAVWNLYRFIGYGMSPASINAMLSVAAVVGVLAICAVAVLRILPFRWPLLAAMSLTAIVALDQVRTVHRHELFAHDFVFLPFFARAAAPGPFAFDWTPAISLVDDPRTHYRIAVTSGPHQDLDNWFVYPFLGRRFQNDVVHVPIAADSWLRSASHATADQATAGAGFDAWRNRLAEQRISRVLSFAPTSVELNWMEHDPDRFRRLAGQDGVWGLFAVADPIQSVDHDKNASVSPVVGSR